MNSANPETQNENTPAKSEKLIFLSVIALSLYSVIRNLLRATTKPLWFDELLTQAVSNQPNSHALWNALKNGADGNPPLFYLIERIAAKLIPSELIAYRLIPALAFAAIVICIYLFIEKRSTAKVALICTILLFITPLDNKYALEARPYSLLAAALALALVCYQRLPAPRWTGGLFLCLAAAESLHYYAGLICFPFFIGELVQVVTTSRIRRAVWLAMFASLIPALISIPLLLKLKQAYAGHIWARPDFMLIPMSYGGYFRLNALWGMAIAIGAVYAVVSAWVRSSAKSASRDDANVALPSEHALVLGFLLLPVFGVIAAKVAHGGATDRYYLPAIFGIVIALSYVLKSVRPSGFKLASAIVLIAFAFQEADVLRGIFNFRPSDDERTAVLRFLTEASHRSELPLVISDAGEYVELSHSADPQLNERIVTLVDPPSAVAYSGTDTVDKLVVELNCCVSLHAEEFQPFAAAHHAFLLYSDGTQFDWWPNRFMHDGATLELVAKQGSASLYRVALNSTATAN